MVTFEQTWPLLLLPAVAVLWWVRRRSLIDFQPLQVDIMVGLRMTALTLVLLAATQPVLNRSGDWLSVAYLLDVSQSVEPRAIEEGIGWIERAEASGAADASRFVAFGGNARPAAGSSALREIPVSEERVSGAVDRSATDLEAAIETALAQLPPYHVRRLVLLTDGRATEGEIDAGIERLRDEGVRVYPRPAPARGGADAWIDRVELDDAVTAGLPFPLAIHVHSPVAADARLAVVVDGAIIAAEQRRLDAGANEVTLRPVVESAGATTLDVVLDADGDPAAENNRVRLGIFARERPRLLYVEGRPETARYLRDALVDGGFEVEMAAPWDLPTRPAAYERYGAVILSDVDARLLNPGIMRALEIYVDDGGGGLVVAGGESVYGEEGYADTAIERAMPVWFKAEREPRDLALVIALDKSYSMVGDKMALAKEASKAAVELLEDDQQFGLLAFDYHFYWPVPIQLARGKERIRERIASIEASSPTNIYPALQDVYASLQAVDAEVKHVILLSDGKTYEDDYEGLLTEMAEADITVSAVAVGDKADRELLGNIARWGRGRSYFIEDPTRVPEIFVDETQMAKGITIEEDESVVPVVRKPIEALAGLDMESAPGLLGYVRTMAKDHAEVIMDTGDEGDPILVRWQYGLGRGVFFAADVKNRWSADWLAWDGYGKFWVQVLRETIRQDGYREPAFSVRRADDVARVSLDLIDQRGRYRNALRPTVRVESDGGERIVELGQSAPGRYEAEIALAADSAASFYWDDGDGAQARSLLPAVSDEHKYRPTDEALLRTLASLTGGVFDPELDELFSSDGDRVVRPLRLWPGLALLALLLYLANMVLRRVRVIPDERLRGNADV